MPLSKVTIGLFLAALGVGFVGGCAPERIIITDADDLAKFAAASKIAAEKRASEPKASEVARPGNATEVSAKKASVAKLDSQSQAFIDRLKREQNYDAATITQFEESLAELPPEMRAIWVAGQEGKANQASPQNQTSSQSTEKRDQHQDSVTQTPPRELPPIVNAKPLTSAQRRTDSHEVIQQIQQADYQQPLSNRDSENKEEASRKRPAQSNTLTFDNQALVSEFQAVVREEMAKLRSENEAAQAIRDEEQRVEDQKKLYLEALRGQGARQGMATEDNLSSALPGLSTGFLQADVAAAIANNNTRKSDKKAPLPGKAIGGEPVKTTTSVPPAASGAKFEEIWNQIGGDLGSDPSLSLSLRRRFLQFAAGDVDAASIAPDEFTASEKQGWKHLVRAFEIMVKQGDHPRRDRQAALVTREIREAIAEFEAGSVLDLQNAAFCSSVQAFGNYVEFESTAFKPNAEVILYVELQNFSSRERADGKAFETEFHGTYQILDASGKRVADHDLPPEYGVCRQRRRDYFLAYPIHLPKNLAESTYTLQLTLEDKISGKFGQTTLKFAVSK